ncbi:hypothetical protein [Burkholderia ubonensis]|nr:hypothetical protein [Burkholderia ubonensis]
MTAKDKQSYRKIERQRADFDFRKYDRGMKKDVRKIPRLPT